MIPYTKRMRGALLACWWVSFLLAGLSCAEVCDDRSPSIEVESILASMGRILNMFAMNPSDMTADVVMGLVITNQLLQASLHHPKWAAHIKAVQRGCVTLTQGFLSNQIGNHAFSTELIPLMLDSTVWRKAVQPVRRVDPELPYESARRTWRYRVKKTFVGWQSDECLRQLFEDDCWLDCPRKNSIVFQKKSVESSKAALCKLMFEESWENLEEPKSIDAIDLLLEEIALCGVEGDANFAQPKLRQQVLGYEENGCFYGRTGVDGERIKRNDSTTKEGCHTHTSAVGLTALAVFLRGIMESCSELL